MFRFYRYLFPGLIALVPVFRLGTILLGRPAPVLDESTHLAVARQFGPGVPSLQQLHDYPSAAGPLFYILFGNLGSLLGFNLMLLRLVVFALALGNIILFTRIIRRLLPAENPMPALALLATAPYFTALAGAFMTEHLALLLGLSALLCFLRFRDQGRPSDAIFALLFATLAIYTRAYYAFLPLTFAATTLLVRRPSLPSPHSSFLVPRSSLLSAPRSSLITHRSSLLLSSLLWLLPIIAFLPLAMLWRGLTPPAYQHIYHTGFAWKNASSILIWTGIIFLPWAWHRLRPWHLLALAAVPAVLLAPRPGLGITRTFLSLLPNPLATALACAFGSIGLLWLLRLAALAANSPRPSLSAPDIRVAAIGALLLAAGLLISGPQVYERYLLPAIPLMLVAARPGKKPALAVAWTALFQLPLALAHILHLVA